VNEEAKGPTDADRFSLELRDLETTVGNKLDAKEAVKNKKDDWRIVWHTAPNFEKAGVYESTITVFYPDGSFDEGTIKVTVKEASKPEEDLEEVTDHTQHADLAKKVTRTIHVHHPDGDKEPVLQTALFTCTKFINKATGEVHHYTDWQAQNDTWEEFVPEKVAGHTHLIDGLASEKVAAKKIDPNNEDHKDEVVHIHYRALPVLPIDPVDPNPSEPEKPDMPEVPDTPEPDSPNTPDTDKPSTNTPDKDVNNGSTNSTHRPGLLPLPVTNSGSSQNTQNTSNPVGVSEPSSLSADSSGTALGDTLPQTGWGHVLAGLIITIWCVLFGLAIHENISSAKKRKEE
jgi:Rib/alpha/Esp surface antigen-like repeat protein